MAERVEEVKEVSSDGRAIRTTEVRSNDIATERTDTAHPQAVVARLIWFVAGILLALLALRFIFALLGANPSNGFANFIYTASHPFVAPFFSLFSYNVRTGSSRLELYTLVAMVIYALIAWGIVRLITINRPTREA